MRNIIILVPYFSNCKLAFPGPKPKVHSLVTAFSSDDIEVGVKIITGKLIIWNKKYSAVKGSPTCPVLTKKGKSNFKVIIVRLRAPLQNTIRTRTCMPILPWKSRTGDTKIQVFFSLILYVSVNNFSVMSRQV